jgi:hypothetical protein
MDEKRIARIIELEGRAEKPVRLSSAIRWQTSKLYWEEANSGTTQTAIAARVGKSVPHVHYMVKIWERYGGHPDKPDFQSLYQSREIRSNSERGKHGERARTGYATEYNGIRFASRLEADYARALDRASVIWEYEPEAFFSGRGGWLPDFLINGEVWVELKPADYTASEIAGQMRRVAVIFETEPEARVSIVFWKTGVGAELVLRGHDGEWAASIGDIAGLIHPPAPRRSALRPETGFYGERLGYGRISDTERKERLLWLRVRLGRNTRTTYAPAAVTGGRYARAVSGTRLTLTPGMTGTFTVRTVPITR